MTEEKKSMIVLIILLIILCFYPSFTKFNAQNLTSYDIALDELHKVFPEVELNISKPQTIYNKDVNFKVVTFLTGATMTTIGVVNILNGKSFDHKSVRNTVPLDPHRLLIGVGLTTISISIFI